MKIIDFGKSEIPAVTLRNKVKLPAGTAVLISDSPDFSRYGGLNNLHFTGVPEKGAYEVVVPDTYRDADAWTSTPKGKTRHYEAGDIISLTYDQGVHFMLGGGRVKPAKGSGISDLRFLGAFQYEPPIDMTRAVSLKQQKKDREKYERLDAEKEKGIFEAQEKLAALKKKRPFKIDQW